MDDRRRRRLVVHQEHLPGETGLDAACEDLAARRTAPDLEGLGAGWPMLPVKRWPFVAASVGLVILAAAVWTGQFGWERSTPEVSRALEPLFGGTAPLVAQFQILCWTLAAVAAWQVLWFRSRSKFDFQGRYRFWPGVTAYCGVWCVAKSTNWHVTLGAMASERWTSWTWRPEPGIWLVAAAGLGGLLAWSVDADIRRSRWSVVGWRITLLSWATSVAIRLFRPDLGMGPWEQILTGFELAGCVGLFVTLWGHARFVAYVCPDPPAPKVHSASRGRILSALAALFSRRTPATALTEEPTKPARRRRKTAEEKAAEEATDDESEAKPARSRASKAAKPTKRPARTRTRPAKVEADVETESEVEAEEESYESYDDSETATGGEWESPGSVGNTSNSTPAISRGGRNSEASTSPAKGRSTKASDEEEDWEALERSTRPNVPAPHFPIASAAPAPAAADEDFSSEGDGDDSDDGIDPSMLKGLSKRQRRELKKKLRDQQRAKQA